MANNIFEQFDEGYSRQSIKDDSKTKIIIRFGFVLLTTNMETNKIKEQFHYFNIQADIDSVYGNWAVSTDGDVVNCLYPYTILAIHFKDTDWMEKMKTKVWFKPECEEALSQALARAKEIIKQKCRETL